jgi:hypothetical protein
MKSALLFSRILITAFCLSLFIIAHEAFRIQSITALLSDQCSPELLSDFYIVAIALFFLLIQFSKKLCLATVVFLICFSILEGGAYVVNRVRKIPILDREVEGARKWQKAELCGRTGYCPIPNSEGREIFTYQGEVVSEMDYSVDSFGRRKTGITPDLERNKFLLFFGGSITYGYPVGSEQTFPYFVGECAGSYQPYNYGTGGYGTNSMLAQLQSPDFKKGVAQRQGYAIYTMIYAHVQRNIGNSWSLSWGKPMPYYVLDDEGRPIYIGPFWESRPYFNALVNLFWKSNLVKMTGLTLPFTTGENDVVFSAALIKESFRLYKSMFPDSRFAVVLYPDYGQTWREIIKRELDDTDIILLDYKDLINRDDEKLRIPIDGHPNGLAHKIYAQMLCRDLALK